MSEPNRNRFVYATLIDLGFLPDDPEILLELGMERPVDWDAVDGDGEVICKRLDFVMTVDYVKVGGEPLGIHFVYDRVRKDHGLHGDAYVYVLALRPTRDKEGRDCDRTALVTAVRESQNVRRRSWCADIGEIRICWRQAPKDVISLDNGAFVPEEAKTDLPEATDEEIERAKTGFDSWCAEVESSPGIVVESETKKKTDEAFEEVRDALEECARLAVAEAVEKGESSSPGIPLDDDDIEFVLDGALVEISTTQDSVPIRMLEKTLTFN